jgi:hypothetical protein
MLTTVMIAAAAFAGGLFVPSPGPCLLAWVKSKFTFTVDD